MRKADAVPLRIAQVDGPAGAVDHLDALFLEMALPLRAVLRRDAEREQVQAAVGVAEGGGQAIDVARLESDEFLARANGQPERPLARPAVLEGPAAHELEAQ